MKLYANLHTHSTHSDGGFSPTELAYAAKKEGYKAIAVTDHDTATGYPELRDVCIKEGLECIFGVEFSSPSKLLEKNAEHRDVAMRKRFHIVGYHFDPAYPAMKKYLADRGTNETEQTHVLFDRGVKLGKIKGIEWEEVLEYNKGIAWLCNEHLWRAMLAKGIVTKADHDWFWSELFGAHIAEVPDCIPFKQEHEIIQLIRDAGGIAILAHPHTQLDCIDALMEMGVEGLEVWHHLMTEQEIAMALELAHKKNLYISGGGDHHGYCSGYYEWEDKTSKFYAPPLTYGTTKEYFEEIKNRKLNR